MYVNGNTRADINIGASYTFPYICVHYDTLSWFDLKEIPISAECQAQSPMELLISPATLTISSTFIPKNLKQRIRVVSEFGGFVHKNLQQQHSNFQMVDS